MTNNEFLDLMSGVLEAFPALKNRYKVTRIYEMAKDLPPEVVAAIITRIGDDAVNTPTINNFKDQFSKWRRDYFAKNGRYWGQAPQDAKEAKFDCDKCIDSGIVEVYNVGQTVMNSHMRCDCEQGKKHWALLPEFDKQLRQAFYTKAPALELFKPLPNENLWDKYLKFKQTLQSSVIKWNKLGYRP